MPWDPVNVNFSFSVSLVVANALPKVLDNVVVRSTSTVVVAERVVCETTVSVNVNVFVVIIFDAKLNTNAYGRNFARVISGVAQRSGASVNVEVIVGSAFNDHTRARRARVWLSRAVSEDVSNIEGQTRKVGRNHLPGCRFLFGGTRGAAKVSLASDFVARRDSVWSVMSVEKVRVNFADAGKTILNDPIFPFEWIFFGSLARFRSCSPDRVGQHGANGNPVWGNGSISTEEVVEEVACRWWRQREKFVDEIDGIVASATVTKDMSCRVSVVRAEATALVVSVCTRVSEQHVVRHRDCNKLSVAWDPGWKTRVVAKEGSGVSRSETHNSTFLVNIFAVCSVVEA